MVANVAILRFFEGLDDPSSRAAAAKAALSRVQYVNVMEL